MPTNAQQTLINRLKAEAATGKDHSPAGRKLNEFAESLESPKPDPALSVWEKPSVHRTLNISPQSQS